MMKKSHHIVYHCGILLYFALLIAACFLERPMTEGREFYIDQMIGVAFLIGGTFIAGGAFFLYDPDEDFEKYMLLPLVPGLVLAYFASRILADSFWFDMQGIVRYGIGLIGVLLSLYIPHQKKLSLHFLLKALSVLGFAFVFLFCTASIAVPVCVFSLLALIVAYIAQDRY